MGEINARDVVCLLEKRRMGLLCHLRVALDASRLSIMILTVNGKTSNDIVVSVASQ
jgi:hypothetical protein